MPTSDITQLYRKKGLYLKNTGRKKGRGLFCLTGIKKGEELEVTPALILNDADGKQADRTILLNYTFALGNVSKPLRKRAGVDDIAEASCVVMGIASFCNHDEEPNAEVIWEEKAGSLYYILRALCAIAKDTEIVTSYGPTWFAERQ